MCLLFNLQAYFTIKQWSERAHYTESHQTSGENEMPLDSEQSRDANRSVYKLLKPRAPNANFLLYILYKTTELVLVPANHDSSLVHDGESWHFEEVSANPTTRPVCPFLAEVLYSASRMIHCCSPLIPLILNNTNFDHRLNLMQ